MGSLAKNIIPRTLKKLIERVEEYRFTSKKRILTLDSLIIYLEKEI